MDISHLHLHVADRARSAAFYQRWFGLGVQRVGEDITFLAGSRRFLLGLMEDRAAQPLPAWFHFGVALPSAQAVRETLSDMRKSGVPIAKPLYEDETLASFRCRDPDGHLIEVYWQREG